LFFYPPNLQNHEITAPHPLGHRLPVFHFMRDSDGLLSEMREGLVLRKLRETRRVQGRLQVLQVLVTRFRLSAAINA
jgi:hypothetical protein